MLSRIMPRSHLVVDIALLTIDVKLELSELERLARHFATEFRVCAHKSIVRRYHIIAWNIYHCVYFIVYILMTLSCTSTKLTNISIALPAI